MPKFQISETVIDPRVLSVTIKAHAAGAYASFEGWVREQNEGKPVFGLRYEAYKELAESEGQAIIEEAHRRFDIVAVACVHRIGDLALGDIAVWVGVTSAHRDAAFSACRWVIDEVKSRVPIWKYEYYSDSDALWLHPGVEQNPSSG